DAGFLLELPISGLDRLLTLEEAALRHLPNVCGLVSDPLRKAASDPDPALAVEEHDAHAEPVGKVRHLSARIYRHMRHRFPIVPFGSETKAHIVRSRINGRFPHSARCSKALRPRAEGRT